MNRLRVRVELNRRKAGVPMEEMVAVVDETRKFFHLLAEDVQIEAGRGDWLAKDFDPESLNFTAEYDGPASSEQVQAFGSAFSGTTSLRQETIAQFTRIADFIGEDEQVGFGLYQSDQEMEPSDWRCLSRRDAVRFTDEILMLAKAAGESVPATPLPAVTGSVGGRRLFKDQRERKELAADPIRSIREMESNLSRRMGMLEGKVEAHTHNIQDLNRSRDVADERFVKLLTAMESFWTQAPRQLAVPATPQLGPPAPALSEGASAETSVPTFQAQQSTGSRGWRTFGLAVGAAALLFAATRYPEISRYVSSSSQAAVLSRDEEPAPSIPIQSTAAVRLPSVLEESAVASPAPKIEPVVAEPAPVARPKPAAPEMSHQVSLEVPAELRSTIDSPVTVDVAVSIDADGRVTTAEVSSTKGANADQLTEQALKVAKWFRFRPTRQGKTAVASHSVLTFVFDPGIGAPAAQQ